MEGHSQLLLIKAKQLRTTISRFTHPFSLQSDTEDILAFKPVWLIPQGEECHILAFVCVYLMLSQWLW